MGTLIVLDCIAPSGALVSVGGLSEYVMMMDFESDMTFWDRPRIDWFWKCYTSDSIVISAHRPQTFQAVFKAQMPGPSRETDPSGFKFKT